MKGWLLPAGALVLVVLAGGAGVTPAPRVAEAGAGVPSVRAVAARREAVAAHEARRLLRRFVAPPGAHPIPKPLQGSVLREPGPGPLGETVYARRFWSVRAPLKTVIAFLRAHRLRGFEPSGASWGSRRPHYLVMNSSERAGGAPTRFLNVTSVGLPRRTLIGAEVEVGWTYPRSPAEKVPAATSTVVVRAPKVSARAADRSEVAQIVRWFDALPVSPPGIAVPCPLAAGADIALSFRSARGAWLASAKLPAAAPASICSSIAFSVRGRQQQPLIDRAAGESFARRLQNLLGVRLLRTDR